jgi:hypothetical protein
MMNEIKMLARPTATFTLWSFLNASSNKRAGGSAPITPITDPMMMA